MYAHIARIYAYGVGFSVVVWMKGQCESLNQRNSNSAVPLFCIHIYLKHMNFDVKLEEIKC